MPAWPCAERDFGHRDGEVRARPRGPARAAGRGCPGRGPARVTCVGQRRGRGEEHLVGDAARADRDRAEADAGEDVRVVALARDPGPPLRSSPGRTGCRRRTAPGRRSTRTPARPCTRPSRSGSTARRRSAAGSAAPSPRPPPGVKPPAIAATPISAVGSSARIAATRSACRRMLVGVRQLVLGELAAPRCDDEALRVEQPAARRACAGSAPSATIAATTRSAMPVAASPAPRKSRRWRSSVLPVTRSAEYRPASATAAVPWMSSLKVQMRSRYFFSSRNALWLAKSSNWMTTPGKTSRGGGDELVDQLVVGGAGQARLRAGRGRAGRRAAPGCWCRRRASPAGTASDGRRRRRCRARACRPGCPCRSSRGRRGRGCARRR